MFFQDVISYCKSFQGGVPPENFKTGFKAFALDQFTTNATIYNDVKKPSVAETELTDYTLACREELNHAKTPEERRLIMAKYAPLLGKLEIEYLAESFKLYDIYTSYTTPLNYLG